MTHCCNCGLRKSTRPSGRCYACEKWWQRKGEERPSDKIAAEVRRMGIQGGYRTP